MPTTFDDYFTSRILFSCGALAWFGGAGPLGTWHLAPWNVGLAYDWNISVHRVTSARDADSKRSPTVRLLPRVVVLLLPQRRHIAARPPGINKIRKKLENAYIAFHLENTSL